MSRGGEMQKNRCVSLLGYVDMVHLENESGSAGLGIISTRGQTKGVDETYQRQVRCIETSGIGGSLKMYSCSRNGTGKNCFAVRPGAATLRWLHLGVGRVCVIEWWSGFS